MAFLRATARGVLLANFSPPVSLLTSFFQAWNIQFAMASSRCSRVFTSIFHPLAAASANGVMPVASSLFVAEAPCCGISSTMRAIWPFLLPGLTLLRVIWIDRPETMGVRRAVFIWVYADLDWTRTIYYFFVVWEYSIGTYAWNTLVERLPPFFRRASALGPLSGMLSISA